MLKNNAERLAYVQNSKNWIMEDTHTDPDMFRVETLMLADNLCAVRIKMCKHCIEFDAKKRDTVRSIKLKTMATYLIDETGVIIEGSDNVSESRLVEELKKHRNEDTTKKLNVNMEDKKYE